tara:strand:- start:2162 stop:2647 length:486 start_codon:yes stop_codon:yes gene_type:complete
MAKIIFDKITGEVYRIAKDQAFLDANKNFNEVDYTILDITTEEFNDLQKEIKRVVSQDGSAVTLEAIDYSLVPPEPNLYNGQPLPSHYETTEELSSYIKEIIDLFKFYLNFNSDKPLATEVESYLTVLEAVDASSLVPLNMSLERYLSDKGNSIIHPLELI